MNEDQDRWRYDAPRALFVRGRYPIVEESVTEELVRDLAETPAGPRRAEPAWVERLRRLALDLQNLRTGAPANPGAVGEGG